jgi:hypothetical protein
MRGLLRPLKEYVTPSILTVGALYFIVLLGCILHYYAEFLYLSSVKLMFLL